MRDARCAMSPCPFRIPYRASRIPHPASEEPPRVRLGRDTFGKWLAREMLQHEAPKGDDAGAAFRVRKERPAYGGAVEEQRRRFNRHFAGAEGPGELGAVEARK